MLYIILAVCLLPFYKFQINPDGISYITIAQKYMHFDFYNAINGYWGPLISWLLIPLLLVGLKPLLAVKLLLLIIGILTIFQFDVLIKKMNISGLLKYALNYLIAILAVCFAFYAITPDIIIVCLSLWLINIMLAPSYINRKYAGIMSGLIGAGLYMAKGYGFYFFITAFFTINLILYFRTRSSEQSSKTGVVFNFVTGFLVFFIISCSWISLLSYKYGSLTINNAASINHAIYGPQQLGIPALIDKGLVEPSNSTSISIWEDPTYIKIQESWNVFDSFDTIKFQIKKTIQNVRAVYSALNYFSIFSIAILFISIIYLLQKGKYCLTDNILILIGILIIMFLSYAMVLIEIRYIWLSDIIIITIGAKLIDKFVKKVPLKKISEILIVIVFSASFLVFPYHDLHSNLNADKTIFDLNNKIANLNIHGRIASSGDWYSTLYLSFYNNWRYYGETANSKTPEFKSELENNKIDYYLVWKPFEEKVKYLDGYEELTNGGIDELRIYKLSNASDGK